MRHSQDSKAQTRSSALWGKGSGGDSRSSALWGKGGRGFATLLVALLAFTTAPIAATAGSGSNSGQSRGKAAFVDPGLLGDAKAHPSKIFRVIVEGEGKGKARKIVLGENGKIRRNLGIVYAVAANLTGRQVVKLAKDKRVTGLTLDARMSGSLYKGDWFWPLNQNKWQGAVQVEGLYTGPDLSLIHI